MKNNRDKKSLAARRLLLETVDKSHQQKTSPYKRKKRYQGTEASLHYLEEVAVEMPGKKTVMKKTGKQRKVLPKRIRRLYREFRRRNPSIKVSIRTWYRHLPKHVKTSRHQSYRQALCEICVNVEEKLSVVNKHLSSPVDGRDELVEISLCADYNLECLERKCSKCGVKLVRHIILDRCLQDTATPVQWEQWEMVKKDNEQRKEKMTQSGSIIQLVENLLRDLQSFAKHTFVQRWQTLQFRTLLAKTASESIAVAVCDFAENHLCRWQDEVHSAHWGYSQVTIHPVVSYYPCSSCHCETVTDYQVFISDDINHDAELAHTIMKKAKKYVEETAAVDRVVFWSDGCAAHYKSKLPFLHCANAKLERAYFGSRHGKSACDACGGVLKSAVDEDVRVEGLKIQNAEQMYQHLQKHFCLPEMEQPADTCCHTKRSFCLVTPQEIDRTLPSSAVKTVPGTRQIHSIIGKGDNVLATRNLSCFCAFCFEGEGPGCASKKFVQGWKDVKLCFSKSWDPAATASLPKPSSCETTQELTPPTAPGAAYFSEVPIHSRKEVFDVLSQQMANTETFLELQELCTTIGDTLASHSIPSQIFFISNLQVSVDKAAFALLPENAPPRHLPVFTDGDGNCFFRAISILCFGTQEYHLELRVRVVAEMIQNFHHYLCPQYLSKGTNQDGMEILQLLKLYSETFNSRFDLRRSLEEEILRIRKPRQDCTMWHLYGASNVLKIPLVSIYPDLGQPDVKLLSKRTILPLVDTANEPKHVMWTASHDDQRPEYWAPRHFVPLLPVHPEEQPSVVEEEEEEGDTILNSAIHLGSESLSECPAEPEMGEELGQQAASHDSFTPYTFTALGDIIAVHYDQNFYLGEVIEILSEIEGRVNFLERCNTASKSLTFRWPKSEDKSIVHRNFVFAWNICLVPASSSGRTVTVTDPTGLLDKHEYFQSLFC